MPAKAKSKPGDVTKVRKPTVRWEYVDLEGRHLPAMSKIPKFFRDIMADHLGWTTDPAKPNLRRLRVDPDDPLGEYWLEPGVESPLCKQCGLAAMGCANPYLKFVGSKNPLVTVVVESPSAKDDELGRFMTKGTAAFVADQIHMLVKKGALGGVTLGDIRFASMTRCRPIKTEKMINWKTKGRWCRYFLLQDLLMYPPRLIMPVGSVALGLLCHKSNANDWAGKVLRWRGWPDDWLTEPKFMKPRIHPASNPKEPESARMVTGHPFMGPPPPPDFDVPIVALQLPVMAFQSNNELTKDRWFDALQLGLKIAVEGMEKRVYDFPWYEITSDERRIEHKLQWLIEHPGTSVCYDTETTGLKPWLKKETIVFHMFRWIDGDGNPQSVGFPWDWAESPVGKALRKRLRPLIVKALSASRLMGHNLTFDMQFVAASLELNRVETNALCDAMHWDTWHMAYTISQTRNTLSLDAVAYNYVPDMAGYEEDMSLLIKLEKESLDPGAGKGGHYANCPREKWESHLKPYVMGDVEVCYRAQGVLQNKLDRLKSYAIPLARPGHPGEFRLYQTPSRAWVYDNVMAPANRLLTKMMSRGMYVDPEELKRQEVSIPALIKEKRGKIREDNITLRNWCDLKEMTVPDWELDLENSGLLKEMLFDRDGLNLPIQRLTKQGRKLLGETVEEWEEKARAGRLTRDDLYAYAAVDKFTLNKLAVDHAELRPLQEYRKLFKVYSTYIRPLRNIMTAGLDKKPRTALPHLCPDSCIHASFMQTGTRGGRLSCRDPNLQQLPSDSTIKRMFVSRFGKRGCLYGSDLSQIELRLLAAACGDASMCKAYFDGLDLHSLTTSRIFKRDYEEFSKAHMEKLQKDGRGDEAKKLDLQRRIGKTCNFLTGYGGGAFGLQTTLANSQVYLPIEECEDILEKFFAGYPALKEMLGHYKDFIMENARAVSIFGRVRVFEDVLGDDDEAISKALRAGCNHLIQATASDMMLTCLVVIEQLMADAGLESMLVSTVHDSLLIDTVKDELPQVHEIVDGVLQNIPQVMEMAFGDAFDLSWMIVPFGGDSEVGFNYLNMVKISEENPDWTKLLEKAKK